MKTERKTTDLNRTLEQLENDYWPANDTSTLIITCLKLREKPLKDFEIEDLRIMIGQNIGLNFLIPLAIERLDENILAEGDYYEGDLLNSVLTVKPSYWDSHPDHRTLLIGLCDQNEELLKSSYQYKDLRQEIKLFRQLE